MILVFGSAILPWTARFASSGNFPSESLSSFLKVTYCFLISSFRSSSIEPSALLLVKSRLVYSYLLFWLTISIAELLLRALLPFSNYRSTICTEIPWLSSSLIKAWRLSCSSNYILLRRNFYFVAKFIKDCEFAVEFVIYVGFGWSLSLLERWAKSDSLIL